MDWLDLLAVQGTLKSLLQHHSSKASILQRSAFFIVQLSHPYMATGKTTALTRQTFVDKVMSLPFKAHNFPSKELVSFNFTIQSYCNIIDSIPCAVYYIPVTYLFCNWECVPLNLLTYSEEVARRDGGCGMSEIDEGEVVYIFKLPWWSDKHFRPTAP